MIYIEEKECPYSPLGFECINYYLYAVRKWKREHPNMERVVESMNDDFIEQCN